MADSSLLVELISLGRTEVVVVSRICMMDEILLSMSEISLCTFVFSIGDGPDDRGLKICDAVTFLFERF